jgi:hypothetical protein
MRAGQSWGNVQNGQSCLVLSQVETSPEEWVKFLSADVEGRRRWLRKRRAKGTRQRLDELAAAFGSGHASAAPIPAERVATH